MCATCGCSEPLLFTPHSHPHEHEHDDAHALGHGHGHGHEHGETRELAIEQDVLAKNAHDAAHNRRAFAAAQVTAFNLTSSPGAGKTTLLEATIDRLAGRARLAVIEGDQETERDAARIRAHGVPAVQINTRQGCHLDARMVGEAAAALELQRGTLLLIENVGNLVCPALFDLGERAKIVLASVTEGEDKPLKYPHMFRAAGVLVLTKVDLLPHLDFDLAALRANAARVNPGLRIFEVSSRDGTGLPAFVDWLASETRSVSS
jgi:hydrogenase nickel incorporation protein HypB